ncbi:gentisate 1,2-dioxygenase [Geobacillus sp. C56-T2]|nr:gentisate 1,2-dioxygenase [Geobacillus sp. C56-T2]
MMADTRMRALERLHEELEQVYLGPLWEKLGKMVTPEPDHEVVPYLWKWETIRKHLLEAGELLRLGRESERRVVYLQNPSLLKRGLIGYSTNTLYVGVQLLLPGEVAPAHRHSQSAIRFIIEGEGAYTAVDGERTYMERGDLILTPAWTWHDHGHEGTEPVIWMDGLDVGLVRNFAGSFFEPYSEDVFPVVAPHNGSTFKYATGALRPVSDRKRKGYPSPLIAYKWKTTKQVLENLSQLDPDPYDGYAVDYINPLTGGSADLRIGTTMQKLTPGMHTKAHRHVHSAVYHVLDGEGYTIINGVKFEWAKGDFFILPPWSWHEHVNTGEGDAHLFSINDLPIMEKLDLEREEEYDKNGGYQSIVDVFEPLSQI